jgi:hypothetical protein
MYTSVPINSHTHSNLKQLMALDTALASQWVGNWNDFIQKNIYSFDSTDTWKFWNCQKMSKTDGVWRDKNHTFDGWFTQPQQLSLSGLIWVLLGAKPAIGTLSWILPTPALRNPSRTWSIIWNITQTTMRDPSSINQIILSAQVSGNRRIFIAGQGNEPPHHLQLFLIVTL